MIAWVVKADRETLDDIATLFCRAGRRIPHRLNALVRHRSTNTRGKQFQHGNQGERLEDRGLRIHHSLMIDS